MEILYGVTILLAFVFCIALFTEGHDIPAFISLVILVGTLALFIYDANIKPIHVEVRPEVQTSMYGDTKFNKVYTVKSYIVKLRPHFLMEWSVYTIEDEGRIIYISDFDAYQVILATGVLDKN